MLEVFVHGTRFVQETGALEIMEKWRIEDEKSNRNRKNLHVQKHKN